MVLCKCSIAIVVCVLLSFIGSKVAGCQNMENVYCRKDSHKIQIPSNHGLKLIFSDRDDESSKIPFGCQWTLEIKADNSPVRLLNFEMPGNFILPNLTLSHERNGIVLATHHWISKANEHNKAILVMEGDIITIEGQVGSNASAKSKLLNVSVITNQSCSDEAIICRNNVCYALRSHSLYIGDAEFNKSLTASATRVRVGRELLRGFLHIVRSSMTSGSGVHILLGIYVCDTGSVCRWMPIYADCGGLVLCDTSHKKDGQLAPLLLVGAEKSIKWVSRTDAAQLPVLTALSVAFSALRSCSDGGGDDIACIVVVRLPASSGWGIWVAIIFISLISLGSIPISIILYKRGMLPMCQGLLDRSIPGRAPPADVNVKAGNDEEVKSTLMTK